MHLPPPVLFDKARHAHLLQQICEIHRSCVLDDHQVLAFLPGKDGDISNDCLEEYWTAQIDRRDEPSRKEIILQMHTDEEAAGYNDQVWGFVVLDMPYAQTGPFRAFVQKLMVSPKYRQQGVARRLLQHVEKVALENRKYLLMLDVPVGSPAEYSRLYEKAGYTEVGTIPHFSVSPEDGSLVDEKFFYKDLRVPDGRVSLNGHSLKASTLDESSHAHLR